MCIEESIKTINSTNTSCTYNMMISQCDWKLELGFEVCFCVFFDGCNLSLIVLFSCRYYYLAFRAHQMPEGSKENAIIILQKAKLEHWVLGKTKVEFVI